LTDSDSQPLLRRILTALTSAIFPHRCLVCDALFPPVSAPGEGGRPIGSAATLPLRAAGEAGIGSLLDPHVCEACAAQISWVQSPICVRCGVMFGDRQGEDHLCESCIRQPTAYRQARAACVYEKTGMALIHSLKYKGKVQLAGPLGAALHATFLQHWQAGEVDAVMPVPLHRMRLRERGFNQAHLLARYGFSGVGESIPRREYRPPVSIDDRSLCRVRRTPPRPGPGGSNESPM